MLDTVELAYDQHGPTDRTPIVFLGSLGSDRSMWRPQVDGLADEHHVITVDLRGHGQSPVPVRTYTVEAIADDVAALLTRLEIARAHIVGLSLGGATAQQLALTHPDRVRSLTLLCTSARFGDPEPWVDRAQSVRANGTESLAQAVVGRWFTPMFASRNPGLVARMEAMVSATSDEGYAASCEALATFDSRAALPNIDAPTLVIGGTDDPATPPAHQEFLADRIPGAHLKIIDYAAHLASYEQRSVVNAAVAEHVAGA
ncbi:3-oxoadipate enol-lactonase [Gordonia humi]|uniref:3-oxoadipate enol-lactonase n=1 Tax=Gordonia humi TaxID=686429 RepID=A0A840ELH7_9ACTN|nr:3-oxoadipate enol-lactonase [Gordonia humi]MBB4133585.1 3-oxoadipate enol-lactonase [Gordonia humi]